MHIYISAYIISNNECALIFQYLFKHPMQLDLGDSLSIQTFASDVSAQFSKVDCLICNAGVLVPGVSNDTQEDDVELQEELASETATWYPENDEELENSIG